MQQLDPVGLWRQHPVEVQLLIVSSMIAVRKLNFSKDQKYQYQYHKPCLCQSRSHFSKIQHGSDIWRVRPS